MHEGASTMLSLKSVHIFIIALSIVVTAGFGTWCLFNQYRLLGVLFLVLSAGLVVYEAYFAATAKDVHLE
jgi:hypothetical protein